jgi:hypothetical protein
MTNVPEIDALAGMFMATIRALAASKYRIAMTLIRQAPEHDPAGLPPTRDGSSRIGRVLS